MHPRWVLVAMTKGASQWVGSTTRQEACRLSFRYGGQMFRHSLGRGEPEGGRREPVSGRRRPRLMEEGILELPRGADLPLFLLSGGKLTAKPEIADVVTLERPGRPLHRSAWERQESNTIYTARIHANHLMKTLATNSLSRTWRHPIFRRMSSDEPRRRGVAESRSAPPPSRRRSPASRASGPGRS